MAGLDLEIGNKIYRAALEINSAIDMSGLSNPRTFRESELLLEKIYLDEPTHNNHSWNRTATDLINFKPFSLNVDSILDKLSLSGKSLDFILSPDVEIIFGTGDHLRDLYEGNLIETRIEPNKIPPVSIKGPDFRFPPDDGGSLGLSVGAGVSLGPINLEAAAGISVGLGPTLEQKAAQLNIVNTVAGEAVPKPNLMDGILFDPYANINVKLEDIGGVLIEKPDFEQMFRRSPVGPAFSEENRGFGFFAPTPLQPLSSEQVRQRNAQSNIDTYFNALDFENGYVEQLIDEIDAVVPFYFQDLRKPERYLYFRAFLTSFGESLNPEWNNEKFYGRIDPVGTYMNTSRTFNVGFKICAMSKQGLIVMWKKINNFCKLVYPTYKKGIMVAAPVVRLKVGDVCSDGEGRGLPGWIENIEFDYSNAPWEISAFEPEMGRAPMWADVSFSFQVIHEHNPAIDENYNFDIDTFRKMGTLSDRLALAGNQQSQGEAERLEQQDSEGTTPDGTNTTAPRS